MILKNIKDKKQNRGFTIVELLVVIVVIGILAAITIVSYTGITSRANTTKALSNAQSAQSVAEIYFAENSVYPATIGLFSTGSTTTKIPSNVTIIAGSAATPDVSITATTANLDKTISWTCVSSAATPSCDTADGGRISYWDYTAKAVVSIYVGNASSATIAADYVAPSEVQS